MIKMEKKKRTIRLDREIMHSMKNDVDTIYKDDVEKVRKQIDSPALITESGETITIGESVKRFGSVEEFSSAIGRMSEGLKSELTKARILAMDNFQIFFNYKDEIDKKRAVEEIDNRSQIGAKIVGIEMTIVESTFKRALANGSPGDEKK